MLWTTSGHGSGWRFRTRSKRDHGIAPRPVRRLRSLTPAGPTCQGRTVRQYCEHVSIRCSLPRMCFRGSITRQLNSLCTLRSAGCPTATPHSVPGGGRFPGQRSIRCKVRPRGSVFLLSQAWPSTHAVQISSRMRGALVRRGAVSGTPTARRSSARKRLSGAARWGKGSCRVEFHAKHSRRNKHGASPRAADSWARYVSAKTCSSALAQTGF